MSLYYQDSYITIYHGDCRDVLPILPKGIIITDPPYNIGYHYEGYDDAMDYADYLVMMRNLYNLGPMVMIHYMEDLCKLSLTFMDSPNKVVAWVYASNTARQWRGIAWWGCDPDFTMDSQPYKNPKDKRIIERISRGEQARLYDWWEVNQVKNIGKDKTEHPCQIPLIVMKRIIKISPDLLIIDPFGGSGTTGRAAKDLKRKCILIEQEEKYCEISAKRLSQEVLL